MAKYTFVNDDTGEVEEIDCKISEYDEIKEVMEFKGFRREYTPTVNMDSQLTTGDVYARSDGGWKENLQRIKRSSGRRNTIHIP